MRQVISLLSILSLIFIVSCGSEADAPLPDTSLAPLKSIGMSTFTLVDENAFTGTTLIYTLTPTTDLTGTFSEATLGNSGSFAYERQSSTDSLFIGTYNDQDGWLLKTITYNLTFTTANTGVATMDYYYSTGGVISSNGTFSIQ